MLIFLSLLATTIFGFTLIVVVNYALVHWENTKINDLASQIKQNDSSDILSKGVASHRFTSLDVSDNLRPSLPHKSFTETAAGFYGKTMTVITTQDYSGWWEKIIVEFKALQEDWRGTLKKWFSVLTSLAKPVADLSTKTAKEIEKEEKQKEEISNVVERVKDSGRDEYEPVIFNKVNDASKTFSISGTSNINKSETNHEVEESNSSNDHSNHQGATIGLGATFDNRKPDKDLTQFEKIEKKILDRLQESGLRDYNIWIQLGDFYLKYEEHEKAKEIFALVLKQASGDQKEIARNRLISF